MMKLRTKSIAEKCIAACLIVCMLLGISPLPGSFAGNRAWAVSGVGYTLEYNFKLYKGDLDTTQMTYEDTGDTWKYAAMDETNAAKQTPYDRDSSPLQSQGWATKFDVYGSDYWFALTLKIDEAGVYDLTQLHGQASGGSYGSIYLAPASVAPADAQTDAYKVGTVNFYAAESVQDAQETFNGIKVPEAGEYYLIYRTGDRPSGSWGNNLYVCGVTLEKTGEIEQNTYIYDFRLINEAYGEDTTKMTYADTGDTWKFAESNGTVETQGYGARLDVYGAGYYVAFGIKVPAAGKYNITQEYLQAAGGGKANIYIAPVSVPIADAQKEQYCIGDISFYAAESTMSEKSFEGVLFDEAGEYNLIYVTGDRDGGWGNCVYTSSLTLEKAAAKNFAYDFALMNESYGGDTTKMTYVDTGDTWKFAESNGSVDTQGYGVRLDAYSSGYYVALDLKIDQAGVYDVTQTYLASAGGGLADVYIAPVSVPIADARKETYLVGNMDFYAAESQLNQTKKLGSTTISAAGEYHLIYETTGKSNGWGNCVYTTGLELTWTGEPQPVGGSDIILNFRDYVGKWPIRDLSIEKNGFEINQAKTSQEAMTINGGDGESFRIVAYGLQSQVNAYNTPIEADTAIDFRVPAAGAYRFSFDGGKYGGGAIAAIYVDDHYVGKYDMYDGNGILIGPTIETRSLELAQGTHTITFRSVDHSSGSWGYNQYIGRIALTKLDAMPKIKEVKADLQKTEFALGETTKLSAQVTLEDGYVCDFGSTLDGAVDDTYKVEFSSENPNIFTVDEDGVLTPKSPGTANLLIKATAGSETKEETVLVTISDSAIQEVKVTLPQEIYTGTSVDFSVATKLENGFILDNSVVSYEISSGNPQIFTVNGFKMQALSAGTADLKVKATLAGKSKTTEVPVTVKPAVIEKLILTADSPRIAMDNTEGVQLRVEAKYNTGMTVEWDHANVKYESLNPEVAAVFANGLVFPIQQGHATIQATVIVDGEERVVTFDVTVGSGKTESTIYTTEKRQAAQENVQKYSWAREMRDAAVAKADQYIKRVDDLYNLIPYEGLPRSAFMGRRFDPNTDTCPYCGTDILGKYGYYAWLMDPLGEPWKVQCPDCRRKFPSNDFESYYQSGLDQKGAFQPELAEQNGQEYLKNILYPEKGEGWGVDDGFGFETGVMHGNIKELMPFVAYFIHWGIFCNTYKTAVVTDSLESFRDAYVYTGDIKYGRAGAMLIDRVADVYPSFDLDQWARTYTNSDGGYYMGKIVGNIWETFTAESYIEAYDAFYPAMEDPQVIEYLSAKAEKHGLENPKTTPDFIRENCETNLCREVFQAAKDARVLGNFGMHQATIAKDAVVLNTLPDSADMIDWLFRAENSPQDQISTHTNTGGNLMMQLTNVISRDGLSNEVSPGYNQLHFDGLYSIADILAGFETYPVGDLYNNPKFIKMFSSFMPLIMVSAFTAQIGDQGSTASIGMVGSVSKILHAYEITRDPELAQIVYFLNGRTTDGLISGIYTKDPEGIAKEIQEVVDKRGEYQFISQNLTGYGLAVLRDGTYLDGHDSANNLNTQRDFWIWYGGTDGGHAHLDKMNLGIEAYGFNMAPDLGYPRQTGPDPERMQWTRSTISHNLVVVDEQEQTVSGDPTSNPMHFDSSGDKVQIMDIDAPNCYTMTDIYRRTVVMVQVDSDVSYGVDFFRVKGGKDHLYSFHSQSDVVTETEGINLIPQVDESGNYVGSYAGPDVPFGPDPKSNPSEWYPALEYPKGYTWLRNVRKDLNVESNKISVTMKQIDYRDALPTEMNLYLRMTMLTDQPMSEVSIAAGVPPTNNSNIEALDYVLVRNKGADGLDTLFSTVYEPYKDERYLADMEIVPMTVTEGSEDDLDAARAIKVTHKNGRIDYVVYATNNQVRYRVDDTFDFRGFIGVVTCKGDDIVYQYLNDGDLIADNSAKAAYEGEVVNFSKGEVFDTTITMRCDADVDTQKLSGQYIYVDNDKTQNGAYRIERAESDANGDVLLHLGNASVIRRYKDDSDLDAGFIYNIEEGQKARIPLSFEENGSPIFQTIGKKSAEVGSELKFTVSAESPSGRELTYRATSLPRGAQFDAETQTFSWIPDAGLVGKNYAAFEVTDGTLSATQYVEIIVYNSASGGGTGPINNTPGSSTTEKPVEPDKPVVTTEKDEVSFAASTNETTAETKLGSVTFADGTFAADGQGKLKIERENKTYTVSVTATVDMTEQPAKVSLAYTPADNMTDENCIIVKDENGNIIPNGRYANGKMTFYTEKLGKFSIEYNPKSFTDLGNHAGASGAVTRLAARGIINGITATTYGPSKNITRADFTTLIVRAFGFTAETASFADVPASAYYAEPVGIAKTLGIVGGVNETDFAPTSEITRQDMMVIVARALEKAGYVLDATENAEFSDIDEVADYAKAAVEILTKAGIITGANGKVNPKGATTRAEVAVILDRILFMEK